MPMCLRIRFAVFFLLTLPADVHAQLLVTEIQSSQSATAPAGKGDYWELTNFGNAAVALGGYKWGDIKGDPNATDVVTLPAGTSIAAGESVIFALTDPASFRSWWNLPAGMQVIYSASAPGLGKDDAIALYNASNTRVLYLSYVAGGFTKSDGNLAVGGHAGISAGGTDASQAMIWDPTSGTTNPRYTCATVGNFGCFQAAVGTDRGSPGVTHVASLPTVDFTASTTQFALVQSVTFTANVQNYSGAVGFLWDFGDGSSDAASGAVATHRYASKGTFSVSVTATAANGVAVKTRPGYVRVTGFNDDSDADGVVDGLEYYFASYPNNPADSGNLPHLVNSTAGGLFRFSRCADTAGLTGTFQASADLVNWSDGVSGVDFVDLGPVNHGSSMDFTYGLPGTGPSPAGVAVDHPTPYTQAVAGAALGGVSVVNLGMVGVGRITGEAVDQFGESMGGSSGLAISGWAYDGASGRFSGTLSVLPDRGPGSQANYAARLHRFGFTFAPYAGAGPVAQGQLALAYQNTAKFTYKVGTSTRFTSGLNPTLTGTLFGQTVGMVTAANGPGGSFLSLLSFDAEALRMLDDGSGFVSDEFGAYIARFDAGLKITGITQLPAAARPHRPVGVLNFDASTTPSNGRRDNQGLEGLAITPDGSRLFALLQSGLVQDIDLNLAESQTNARLFVYDISGARVDAPLLVGEYVVKLPRYDSNGNGSGVNHTASQSEILAIGSQQFLMLPEDANGFGSGSIDPGIYKAVQLVDFSGATNILGLHDAEGDAVSPAGVLDPAIQAAASKDVINLLNPADLARFGINTNNPAPNSFTFNEKLEGMALVPDLSTPRTDDYFLFVANDNDYQSSQVRVLNSVGSLQNFGDGRVNVGNGLITHDSVFYVYRLVISPLKSRYYRMKVTGG
ncbi:MAG: esterase-like activity of phytase family protein [Verrucomicrobiota bacterium]